MSKTNPEYIKNGLEVEVTFYRESGKYYTHGNVNIGDVRMHHGNREFMQAIIDNQQLMSGNSWVGEYHVVTRDTDDNWKHRDYHEFSNAIFPAERWIGLRV
ncbi:hypothetical protein ABGV42_01270 [Paenibacillus pabuli]|uniref:hypothetical protein n=1 Tax=Paenibacillus pabuli TaxID=1472 RepID=UPI00324280AA